jgi:hypothetical protein
MWGGGRIEPPPQLPQEEPTMIEPYMFHTLWFLIGFFAGVTMTGAIVRIVGNMLDEA